MNAHERLGRALHAMIDQDPDRLASLPEPVRDLYIEFKRFLAGEREAFQPPDPSRPLQWIKRVRRCSICRDTGHTSRKCPKNPRGLSLVKEGEE